MSLRRLFAAFVLAVAPALADAQTARPLSSGLEASNSDATIQQLRDQINVETDTNKRAALWQQAQDYLMQNGPWATAIQPGVYIATKSNIGNYVWNPAWRVNPYVLTKS